MDMSRCEKCISSFNGTDASSLINIYTNPKFAKEIPSVWTDWYNRLDSTLMVIGQDWGPYKDMVKLNQKYLEKPTVDEWNKLIDDEKSLTKKQLTNYLIESSNGRIDSISNIYITNAIMCARKGNNYRGNNINLKYSTVNCQRFLLRQIEIVKPKVIVTLGYYPLLALANIYDFQIEKTLAKTLLKYPVIKLDDFVIIPLYHPVAQIKKEKQLEQYKRIWTFI